MVEIGDKIIITTENYNDWEKWDEIKEIVYIVSDICYGVSGGCSDPYCSHRGYDESVKGEALLSAKDLPISVYEYEVEVLEEDDYTPNCANCKKMGVGQNMIAIDVYGYPPKPNSYEVIYLHQKCGMNWEMGKTHTYVDWEGNVTGKLIGDEVLVEKQHIPKKKLIPHIIKNFKANSIHSGRIFSKTYLIEEGQPSAEGDDLCLDENFSLVRFEALLSENMIILIEADDGTVLLCEYWVMSRDDHQITPFAKILIGEMAFNLKELSEELKNKKVILKKEKKAFYLHYLKEDITIPFARLLTEEELDNLEIENQSLSEKSNIQSKTLKSGRLRKKTYLLEKKDQFDYLTIEDVDHSRLENIKAHQWLPLLKKRKINSNLP